MAARYRSDMLCSGFVKLFVDGVIESGTARDGRGLCRPPGLEGRAAVHARALRRRSRSRPTGAGLQIAVHAIGDGAVRIVLDGYEAALKANGRRDSRHRVEHVEVIHPDDIPRFAELGVIASMQPPHPPGYHGLPLEPYCVAHRRARAGPMPLPGRRCARPAPASSSPPTGRCPTSIRMWSIQSAMTRPRWNHDHARQPPEPRPGAPLLHAQTAPMPASWRARRAC